MASPLTPHFRHGSPFQPPKQITNRSDRLWKHLTEQANLAFSQGHDVGARTIYLEALAEAETLFDAALQGRCSLPVPVILNISCHNLAEFECRHGNHRTAEAYVRRAYDRLVDASRSPTSPLPLRIASVQHLKHALAMLVRHYRSNGKPKEDVKAAISLAHDTAFSVLHAARHAEMVDASCARCRAGPRDESRIRLTLNKSEIRMDRRDDAQ